ncbi:ribosome biogenesis GTPase YqeH [Mesoplasma photuris]|uniref:ribosome biogenesis GTPase YqeH n=1 Tax=Mesoplasma photuris TaxID=217731 RepID=UPI0004E108DB|nr:ribosome biogenesis GTPase YqeH [Mesoplasma photuris]
MKKCIGCGNVLQTESQKKTGYAVKLENDYCLRCFRIKNYNDLVDQDINQDQFIENIKEISKSKSKKTFYYIVDIFDLEGTRMLELEQVISKHNVIIVVNKIDLMPKAVKLSKIRRYVANEFKNSILKDAKIVLTTTMKQNFVTPLLNIVLKDGNEQYFVGVSNVGKSSIINAILKANNLIPKILESKYFNTTLDIIEIKLNSKVSMFDTPGVARVNSIANIMETKDWEYCYFKKEIKQFTFQLNSEQTIFFAGLAWFDFLGEGKTNFHIYTNKEIDLHRTKTTNSIDYWNKNRDILSPTIIDDKFKKHYFEFTDAVIGKEYDIVISGLGWIHFIVEHPMTIVVNIPKEDNQVLVYSRDPLI